MWLHEWCGAVITIITYEDNKYTIASATDISTLPADLEDYRIVSIHDIVFLELLYLLTICFEDYHIVSNFDNLI